MNVRRYLFVLIVAVVFSLGVLVFGQEAETTVGAETAKHLDEIQTGEEIYAAMCLSCHGGEGEGDLGPPLAGNQTLQSDTFVVRQIVLGGGGMPAFGPPQMNEEQIANVTTYVRTSFGNEFGEVSADRVSELIGEMTP